MNQDLTYRGQNVRALKGKEKECQVQVLLDLVVGADLVLNISEEKK